MRIEEFNSLTVGEARAALMRCCGSSRWVDRMLELRPFSSRDSVAVGADEVFAGLIRSDWLEAFDAHPRIGDIDALRKKFQVTADLCGAEQAGVATADEDTLRRLVDGNRRYRGRFGYIFIVCATGKSAAEMLAGLELRLHNDLEIELQIAAEEQRKITHLRLEKL